MGVCSQWAFSLSSPAARFAHAPLPRVCLTIARSETYCGFSKALTRGREPKGGGRQSDQVPEMCCLHMRMGRGRRGKVGLSLLAYPTHTIYLGQGGKVIKESVATSVCLPCNHTNKPLLS